MVLIKLYILIFMLFTCCSSNPSIEELEFNIVNKSFSYNIETQTLSAVCEIQSNMYDLFSVHANLNSNINDSTIYVLDLNMNNEQDNQFSYIGYENIGFIPYGDYYMEFVITSSDSIYQLNEETGSQNISLPVAPEIISVSMDSIIELSQSEWVVLPINLYAYDQNGIDDILRVEYKIKGSLIFECTGELVSYPEYTNLNNNDWVLDEHENQQGQNFLFHRDLLFRPLDGSAHIDENGVEVFPAEECGKVGEILFQFTIFDKDGLFDIIEDIPLEITF